MNREPEHVNSQAWSAMFALLMGHGGLVGFDTLPVTVEREITEAGLAEGYIMTFKEAPDPIDGLTRTWMRVSYGVPRDPAVLLPTEQPA